MDKQPKIPPEVDTAIAVIASGCGLTVLVVGLSIAWFVYQVLSR